MKKLSLIFCLAWIVFNGFAGDIATFANLGFSDDSKFFMFAQYGVKLKQATPYAELFLVDVQNNTFVSGGVKEFYFSKNVEPGDIGEGALFKILEDNLELTRKYEINHLDRGRILYQLLNGDPLKQTLQFRDFNTNNKYDVVLIQTASGINDQVQSSFYIDLSIDFASGRSLIKKVGHATFQRKGIKSYKIRQIFLSPEETSLIMVIEKEQVSAEGISIRYMIEAVRIN